eukprot:12441703-Alexandrium_andersonii.AAC.1
MSASLVGSEMCIRDSSTASKPHRAAYAAPRGGRSHRAAPVPIAGEPQGTPGRARPRETWPCWGVRN